MASVIYSQTWKNLEKEIHCGDYKGVKVITKGTKPCNFVMSGFSPQPKLYSNEAVPPALELETFTLVF